MRCVPVGAPGCLFRTVNVRDGDRAVEHFGFSKYHIRLGDAVVGVEGTYWT